MSVSAASMCTCFCYLVSTKYPHLFFFPLPKWCLCLVSVLEAQKKKWGSPSSVKAEILFYHVSKLFHSEVFLSLALNISESY